MRFRFLFRTRKKSQPRTSTRLDSLHSRNPLPDVFWTSIRALKESADAFPPLKSAVGGVIAVYEIVERAKHAKSDARDVALCTKAILNVVAEAVPDPSEISLPMLQSIERFTTYICVSLFGDIRCSMEAITLTGGITRLVNLNRNECALGAIKAQRDGAYRDFVLMFDLQMASTLRLEVQQERISVQLAQTHLEVGKVNATVVHVFYLMYGNDSDSLSQDALALDQAQVLFYAKVISFFWPSPDGSYKLI
ncbi:hypothetical protein B0H17DRAFT_1184579 [Mycena rosella]|uniref:Uncharacterized protein n=1 Tax=Mycena rosella TaxID=1033263 RepID=A0AAD7CW74_MYCRO|nr:hypothetical protein B0H17DRAFT_1184579 [Mycena rosella]